MMFGNPIDSTNTTKPAKNTTAEAQEKISFHSWLLLFPTYRRPPRKQRHVTHAGAEEHITYLLIYIFLSHFARPVKGKQNLHLFMVIYCFIRCLALSVANLP
jgi:hypothetical protein